MFVSGKSDVFPLPKAHFGCLFRVFRRNCRSLHGFFSCFSRSFSAFLLPIGRFPQSFLSIRCMKSDRILSAEFKGCTHKNQITAHPLKSGSCNEAMIPVPLFLHRHVPWGLFETSFILSVTGIPRSPIRRMRQCPVLLPISSCIHSPSSAGNP